MQFGHALFIEPSFGLDELNFEEAHASPLHNDEDEDDVRHTPDQAMGFAVATDAAIRDPATLTALLGVSLSSIPELAAKDRHGAVRAIKGESLSSSVMPGAELGLDGVLGTPGRGDAYYLPDMLVCEIKIDSSATSLAYALLPELGVFITRARYDRSVYTPALPAFLNSRGVPAHVDESEPAGAARGGELVIPVVGHSPAKIRFPEYEAGHEVTETAAPELAADIQDWLKSEGLIR